MSTLTTGWTRRDFLKTSVGATAFASTLWLRRPPATSPRSVKRVVIVDAVGGLRWAATFDAQREVERNPWGILPWHLVGRGVEPEWGFSRMLVQRPMPLNATRWRRTVYPYLSSNDPAHFNVNRPALTRNVEWDSALLPTFADIARDVAVVRVTQDPRAPFDGDHASARHALCTGSRAGRAGFVTAVQYALEAQLGSGYERIYGLPGVAVGDPAWAFGGDLTATPPIFLTAAAALPRDDGARAVETWAAKAQAAKNVALRAARKLSTPRSPWAPIDDEPAALAHGADMAHPALQLASAASSVSTFGTLADGVTPVSNRMLAEVFGITSAMTPPDDILFDAFGALASSTRPTWTSDENPFALNGALAVRLLQMGAPIVSMSLGRFDTHSYEVVGPQARYPHTVQIVQLTRLLTGLEFALTNIADPQCPTASLWDSTVVFVCSEFGRGGSGLGPQGFNSSGDRIDGGSDHDPFGGWPVLGGPVAAPGSVIKDPIHGGHFHQNRLLTTVLEAMGIDDTNNPFLPYGVFPPIKGLLARA